LSTPTDAPVTMKVEPDTEKLTPDWMSKAPPVVLLFDRISTSLFDVFM
jgi:hypothetical protein